VLVQRLWLIYRPRSPTSAGATATRSSATSILAIAAVRGKHPPTSRSLGSLLGGDDSLAVDVHVTASRTGSGGLQADDRSAREAGAPDVSSTRNSDGAARLAGAGAVITSPAHQADTRQGEVDSRTRSESIRDGCQRRPRREHLRLVAACTRRRLDPRRPLHDCFAWWTGARCIRSRGPLLRRAPLARNVRTDDWRGRLLAASGTWRSVPGGADSPCPGPRGPGPVAGELPHEDRMVAGGSSRVAAG